MSRLSRAVAVAAVCLATLSPNALASQWEAPVVIAPEAVAGTSVSWAPVLATDAGGTLTAAWAGDGASGFGIYSATRAASLTGPWSTPVRLAATLAPRDLRLAVNPSGQAVVGWYDVLPNSTQLVLASRTAAGTWSAPTRFPGVASYQAAELQIDPAGRAIGVLAEDTTALFRSITQVAGNTPVLSDEGPAALTNADQGSPFDLAIDGNGTATVLYLDSTGLKILSSSRTATTPWQPSQLIEQWTPPASSEVGALAQPHLAVNASGRAAATWLRGEDNGSGLQVATRTVGGAWSLSTSLVAIGNSPTEKRLVASSDVAIDAVGNVTAAWNLVGFDVLAGRLWVEVRSQTAPVGAAWGAVEITSLFRRSE